jgi:hypothetical protein
MRKLLGALALAALLAGCGSDTKADTPTPTVTATSEAEADVGHNLEGYSKGVKDYYGGAHTHEDGVEAEYHQPPMPPETALGGPITLTGTNIGIRLVITPTKVSREGEITAIELDIENTGIANYEAEFMNAAVTYDDGTTEKLAAGERADCSNGFETFLRIETSDKVSGCLLFPRAGSAKPERLQLALEAVPVEAGGIWNLG